MLPKWSDVKDHPEDRMLYHKANYDELVESLDTLSKLMLKDAETEQQKTVIRLVRLVADSMVKCFEQMYYDVQSGCPGWKCAQWVRSDTVHTELGITELVAICEALSYVRMQITNSHIPVFADIADHLGSNSKGNEAYTVKQVEQAQELVDGILNTIQKVIDFSAGTIVVNG